LRIETVLEELKQIGIIKRKIVEDALKDIPRKEFLPDEVKHYADLDTPIPIGHNQTTSAIHMIAIICESINLSENDNVLEIGTGSGYMASIYNYITKQEVISIEIIKDLAVFAKKNLRKLGLDAYVHVINADATYSIPLRNKFDAVIVTACSKNLPKEYLEVIKDNGRLIIPIGSDLYYQDLIKVIKKDGKIKIENLGNVAFVPLKGSGRVFSSSE
jgi:protein-L-isoaspartate(D-aspartate) O-methyltransferase